MNGEDAALVSDDGGDPGFSRNVSSPGADISHNLTSTPSSTDSKGSAGRPWKSRVKSALGSLRKKRRASREKANSAMAEPSSSEDSEVVETQGGNVDAGDVVKSLDFKLSSASSGSTAGPPSGAFPSDSNLSTERSGDATDPDLLAILREVSLKSSGAGRFDDNEDVGNTASSTDVENSAMRTIIAADLDDIEEETLKSSKTEPVPVSSPRATEAPGYGIKSEFQSTFQGERGGSAEDAELLALLRGVSAKSSGADRFADSSDDVSQMRQSHERAAPSPVSAKSETAIKKSDNLPPWKRRGPAKANTVDAVVVAAPKPKGPAASEGTAEQVSLAVEASGYGIKSEFQSTFQGERGGSAEDAELLALLRGVSAKSSSADRFADSSDDVPQVQPIRRQPAVKKNDNLPPWKRRGPATAVNEDVVAVAAPKAKGSVPSDDTAEQVSLAVESTGYGIKSEFQSTFQGERGGSAEDAGLLALLRGVSSKSSGADRFADSNDAAAEVKENRSQTLPKQESIQKPTPNSDQSHPNTTLKLRLSENSSARNTEQAEDQSLDRGSVKEALESKDWKTRVRAFEYLISNTNGFSASHELFDSDVLLEGLDAMIPRFFEDMQVAVLDKALEFGLLYANYCKGATKPEQARAISSSLLKKNAFASRPSTTSLAHSLVLKLIEVGDTGKSSLDAVVDVMLHEGLISKKPKIVQAVSIILHDVTIHFGFANLPLPSLVEHLPKLLAHTNAVVRENGLKITAEICRGLGSKAAIQNVVDLMKSAQISQLDKLLDEQSHPSPTLTGFRSLGGTSAESTPDSDAVAMLAVRAEELEAERFASRPAVDLISSLNRTEYSVRLQRPKWSEKVAALQMALECGGQKPYKLVQPSSTVNYGPLIADMKGLLSHTHFAVCNNAMQVLCMLAEGVGEKLFPNLRPLLSALFRLSKDKKLTKGVGLCLDSFFGNIVGFTHLLEDDALPASFDEKVEKNALARTSSMEFLGRCVSRGSKAGPRGTLDGDNVTRIASLCTEKLDDSDAAVRKASMNVLQLLIESANPEFCDKLRSFVESLRVSNPRAHKVLSKATETTDTPTVSASETTRKTNKSKPSTLETRNNAPSRDASNAPVTATEAQKVGHKPEAVASNITKSPGLEEALEVAASLNIPLWGDIDENGGIYAGFKSAKWLYRQNSIKGIINYIESGNIDTSALDVETKSSALMFLVKEHTRGFKETNVNILKAIMDLFIAVCEYHEAKERLLGKWVVYDGVDLAIQKISDKKLVGSCKALLTHLCVVASPGSVFNSIVSAVKVAKAPLVHEESLRWVITFYSDFGAFSLNSEVSVLASWAAEELKTTNPKIKKEAQTVLAELVSQLGPRIKVLVMSLIKSPEIKSDLELCFAKVSYDPSSLPTSWPKQSLADRSSSTNGPESKGTSNFDLPKTDLFSLLPPDTVSKLGTLSGKAAWKQRKEALDEVDRALSECGGLVDSGSNQKKKLADLARALKDRLSDTQINLKPVAAKSIGTLLSSVESSVQAKLGRIVYSPLVNAAMIDIKKPMRDACLTALRAGTSLHSTESNGLNIEAVEPLVSAVISEVTESTTRAPGLAEVLEFLCELAATLPNLDESLSSTGQPLGVPFAQVIVECLTSSKTETRSAATRLLEVVLGNRVIGAENFRKAVGKLVPAKQRTVGPLVAKYAGTEGSTPQAHATFGDPSKSRSVPARTSTKLSAAPNQKDFSSRQPQNGIAPMANDRAEVRRHPLQPKTNMMSLPTCKGMVWPEYPEEPQGTSIYLNLKKSWSQILSAKAFAALFPSTGIRKQDEAKDGCEVLQKALQLDREAGYTHVVQQLDFILKWTVFSLCSRETTTGLQTLLMFVKELLAYLVDYKHELSDSEALDFVPYLIDRASNAKGRFGEVLNGIVEFLKKEELLPPKRLGSVVCIAVIERSPHAKARALACQICHDCIETIGLNGCGKKGVVAAAKAFSEEKVAETRLAALNLLEMILAKMNGDIQRLSRICGPALSMKATSELEEKWNKRNFTVTSPSPHPNSHKFTKSADYDENGLNISEDRQSIRDELPSFRLDADPPLATSRDYKGMVTLSETQKVEVGDHSEGTEYYDAKEHSETPGKLDGTAASLRMRLLQIKGKGNCSDQDASISSSLRILPENARSGTAEELSTLKYLLKRKGPLPEHDEDLIASIEALKRIHAALANQSATNGHNSDDGLLLFRESMAAKIDELVDLLTQLIEFSFECGIESVNAKMSIPLLSVCLATLMALFRDNGLAHSVSQDNLTVLIRQTGTALLDDRFGTFSVLDEATASQMVRALNKLAVQAATGAVRQYSFMALLALQQQLSSENSDDAFSSRLSRVILKLFIRVVKAEEVEDVPYHPSRIDMEALVCTMEDGLEKCSNVDSEISGAYSEMVHNLVQSISANKGSAVLLKCLEALDLDSTSSALWRIVQSVESQPQSLESDYIESQRASRDVATLVSALGNAPEGPQREAALNELLAFKNAYGDEELDNHLRQLSSAFRSFIEDQLRQRTSPSKPADHEQGSANMSDRLRSLRSRLKATELALQTNVEDFHSSPDKFAYQDVSGDKLTDFSGDMAGSLQRSSKLLQPSPSRVAVAGNTTSSSLQERLAMAQDSRKGASVAGGSSSSVGTSMGRAAALRARLEAVKNKGKSTY